MATPVLDNEVVLRHIPGGTLFQAPGPRITSRNFELRPDDRGLSVSRFPPTSPAALIARVSKSPAASRVAAATAGAVRALGLDVIPDEIDPDDMGHALIIPAAAALADKAVRDRLARVVFQLLPPGA